MGEVYLGTHSLLKRPTAVKLLRPELAGQRALERFAVEVRQTSRLSHPNTVSIYDYGHTAEGLFYYAMEYLHGADLRRIVEHSGPMSPARVIHVLSQACGALAEAHGKGLIHRDIKAANIMLCEQGGEVDVVKLLDFGLVLATGPRGSAGAAESEIVGTPAYMAPEQAAGLDLLDGGADPYGLGRHRVLPAYWRSAVPESRPRASPGGPPRPSRQPSRDRLAGDLPADVKAVVLRCLEKDPARRDPDADSVERALAACSCAGSWTLDEADDWWRENAPDGAP